MILPKHVGFIIDGNRRWAKERGKNAMQGHTAGFASLKDIVKYADEKGINHITLYVWSLKNESGRSSFERGNIFGLLINGLSELFSEAEKRKSRVQFLGRWKQAKEISKKLEKIMNDTKHFTDKSLNFCFMYDGQAEIADAVNSIIKSGVTVVDEKKIKEHLYSKHIPPLDLIIRTGMSDGCRLSGFMLWDASYAELIFHNTYWPDYSKEQLDADLEEFSQRNRRFGT